MPHLPEFNAFTLTNNGTIREIVTETAISMPLNDKIIKNDDPRIYHTKALWDTGATASAITRDVARKMQLKPIGQVDVCHAKGTSITNVYLINFYLPNGLIIPKVRVTECESSAGNFGVIIGMDIITLGDFSVTNKNGHSTFSYRIPSISNTDFTKEAGAIKKFKEENNATKKIGRNDPCYCGSGKKFKNCHGKN